MNIEKIRKMKEEWDKSVEETLTNSNTLIKKTLIEMEELEKEASENIRKLCGIL